jgi:hypothetical protein
MFHGCDGVPPSTVEGAHKADDTGRIKGGGGGARPWEVFKGGVSMQQNVKLTKG